MRDEGEVCRQRARTGDRAFTDFMVAAEPSLMRTAWLLTGSTEAARELVQAALVKTYVSWAKVRPETALAFARRVLVNHKGRRLALAVP